MHMIGQGESGIPEDVRARQDRMWDPHPLRHNGGKPSVRQMDGLRGHIGQPRQPRPDRRSATERRTAASRRSARRQEISAILREGGGDLSRRQAVTIYQQRHR